MAEPDRPARKYQAKRATQSLEIVTPALTILVYFCAGMR